MEGLRVMFGGFSLIGLVLRSTQGGGEQAKRPRIPARLLGLEMEILNVLFCDFKIPSSIAHSYLFSQYLLLKLCLFFLLLLISF
jgi:hypothetical protein